MGSAPRLMRFVVGLEGQAAEKAIKALMIARGPQLIRGSQPSRV